MPFAPVPVRISNRYFYDQPLAGPFEAVALPIHAGRNSHIVWVRSQPLSLHARQTRICPQAVRVFALDAESLCNARSSICHSAEKYAGRQ